MRQQDESQPCFRDVLTYPRNYITTPRQAEWLQQLKWHHLVKIWKQYTSANITQKRVYSFS